ncbi:hypothetical protein FQR65_LT13589 [Abscondita terminalis]|nr:hypothetical protein FQR65_LT13589 [Abscondita terminalis]
MKYNDTVFEASSMEIFDLARNFNNDGFQHKLLDNLVIKKRTKKSKREENVHFKAHPNLLAIDSNVLEKTFLENDHEEFCDTDSEHNFDFFLSKHKDNLSQPSPFEKEGIESKVELQTIRCEINNSSTKLRLIEDLIIRSMQRTCTCLDEISKVTMPDGEDDWRRRQVRTIEFSSRFKRNYLYELGRQIIELEKAVKGSRSPGGFKSVPRCVLSAHQTLLQAFQAYNNHIPTCLGNVATDKLQIAIDHANKLFKVHLELLGSTDPGTEMKKSLIESITGKFELVLLKATNVMVEPVVHAQSNIPSIKTYLSTTKLKKKIRKKMGSKFSMYIIPPTLKKGEVWKKSTNSLATDKHLHNIQSRYKTAGFKHRPQIEKSKTANVLLKNKLDSPKSAPCLTTMSKNEDNIETMVERIKHWEDDEGHCKAGITLSSILHLPKNVLSRLISSDK